MWYAPPLVNRLSIKTEPRGQGGNAPHSTNRSPYPRIPNHIASLVKLDNKSSKTIAALPAPVWQHFQMGGLGKRLRQALKDSGTKPAELARLLKVTRGAVDNWLHDRNYPSTEMIARISEITDHGLGWLLTGKGRPKAVVTIGEAARGTLQKIRSPDRTKTAAGDTTPNAIVSGAVKVDSTVPLYGHAVGGKDGRFIWNGEKIGDVLAPPQLASISNAYAVSVVGNSMEPRYFAGEVVFVNPHKAARRHGFVVVQIRAREGEPPDAYVKQFLSMDGNKLTLEQLNPRKRLTFKRADVVSVHRIVMGGDG